MIELRRRSFVTGVMAALASGPRALRAAGVRSGLASLEPAIRPGDDFYRYANEPWLKRTAIAADKASADVFSRLADLNAVRVRAILEDGARRPANATDRKFGDLYASLTDTARIEQLGIDPVRPALARIAAIAGPSDLAGALAGLTRDTLRDPASGAYPGPIAALAFPDIKQPTRYLPTLAQGGLGLPDRDAYLSDKPRPAAIRAAYRDYLEALFMLGGFADAKRHGDAAYALEEKIARGQRSLLETFDLNKRYNLWAQADFEARAPGLDWAGFLERIGFAGRQTVLVADPAAIAATAVLARDASLDDWRDYLTARTLAAFSPVGPRAFAAAHFAFAETVLKGVPEAPPQWRQAATLVDQMMGPAVGAAYLRRHFTPAAAAAAATLTKNVTQAMHKRIAGLVWMTPATKTRALAKLAAVRIDVGGETRARDYAGLRIDRAAAWANVTAAARHIYAGNLDRLDRPLDRGEWEMLPHTVNAQSNPILNKIMFPAGIMQAPLFDADADAAVNYGAIGMFIGHEISHLFDNIGALFDERGQFANWWQPVDKARFDAATASLARQYDSYRPFSDLYLNGRQTLHENVADLGGLALALDAYRASGAHPAKAIDGLSGDQRFFVAFAQLWREKTREPAFRQQVAVGTHSHGEWRVMTVRNIDSWYDAFAVGPGDRLYLAPADRVKIW